MHTRTRTSSRATPRRCSPATRSASSPGSTSRAGSGCGSRTSSSPPPTDRRASTRHLATSRSSRSTRVRLDLASVLLQWTAGGLLGLWVTGRHRMLGVGYGWLLRSVYGTLALGAVAAGIADADSGAGATVRDAGTVGLVLATAAALLVSIVRRREPQRIPVWIDLVAPVFGAVALLGAADAVGGDFALSAARLLVGAVFLGFVTDSMLLGHWYLVQPGLSREPLREMIRLSAWSWPFDVALLLVPPG